VTGVIKDQSKQNASTLEEQTARQMTTLLSKFSVQIEPILDTRLARFFPSY